MQNNRLSKNNQGVTLIEVIAVVAVLGIVMAAVTGFMITGTKMSARVSDTAASSMKDETAVEYINRWILASNQISLPDDPEVIKVINEVEYSMELCIGNAMLKTVYETDTNDQPTGEAFVVYHAENKTPIELCSGEIYFEPINNGTVTYYLNGKKHVVHLRVAASTEEESDVGGTI